MALKKCIMPHKLKYFKLWNSTFEIVRIIFRIFFFTFDHISKKAPLNNMLILEYLYIFGWDMVNERFEVCVNQARCI